jgi:sugar lactone lactonase YvrE
MKTKCKSIIRTACHSFGGAACAGAALLISTSAQAQNLFVDSYFNGTIVEITPGRVQSTFASGLSYPEGMAFNSAGDLFVAEFGAANGYYGTIVEITPGGVQSTFASGLNSPVALAFSSTGDLFVDSYSSGTINKITPGGVKSTFASGLSYPQGLAFNSAGDLFVVSYGNSSIYEITPGGVKSTFASGLKFPYGVAFNNADDLFEADGFNSTINEFTPSGAQSTFASGLYNVYNCLAFDSAGNLFVAEYGTGNGYNGTIIEITPGGTQSTFASGLYSPEALAFQPVPEPSALGLLLVGVTALLVCRRRNLAASLRQEWRSAYCRNQSVGKNSDRSLNSENSTPLWSHHSILRSDETWLPEWSGNLGGVQRWRSSVASGVLGPPGRPKIYQHALMSRLRRNCLVSGSMTFRF